MENFSQPKNENLPEKINAYYSKKFYDLELEKLKSGDKELAKEIIQRAELGGETYVPDCDYNEEIYGDEEKFEYIEFLF